MNIKKFIITLRTLRDQADKEKFKDSWERSSRLKWGESGPWIFAGFGPHEKEKDKNYGEQ